MAFWSRISSLNHLYKLNQRSNILIRTYVFKPECSTKNVLGNNQIRYKSIFKRLKRIDPAKYKSKDAIPESFELIYRNTMERYLLSSQILSAACLVLVAVVVVRTSAKEDNELNFESWGTKPKTVENEIFVYLAALAAFAVALQYLVVRMPLRIYSHKNMDKYIFVNHTAVPFKNKKVACARTDISKAIVGEILPWNKSKFDVKNNPMFIIESYFRTPADFYIMIGEQDRDDED